MIHIRLPLILFLILTLTAEISPSQSTEDVWPNIIPQETNIELSIDSVKAIKTVEFENTDLLSPGLLKAHKNVGIFYDFYRNQIYRINLDERSLPVEIGFGNGAGPGEFRSILSIAISDENDILAVDPRLQRISKFNKNGDITESFRLEEGVPSKVSFMRDYFVVKFQSVSNNQNLFGIYDTEKRLVRDFHPTEQLDIPSPLFYEGRIASDNERIVYGSLNYGVIMIYDFNNQKKIIRSKIQPIDGLKLNKEQTSVGTMISPARESRTSTLDIEIFNEEIVVLQAYNYKLRSDRLDFYDIHTGDYLRTTYLDKEVINIAVRDDEDIMYAVEEDLENGLRTIHKYKF